MRMHGIFHSRNLEYVLSNCPKMFSNKSVLVRPFSIIFLIMPFHYGYFYGLNRMFFRYYIRIATILRLRIAFEVQFDCKIHCFLFM